MQLVGSYLLCCAQHHTVHYAFVPSIPMSVACTPLMYGVSCALCMQVRGRQLDGQLIYDRQAGRQGGTPI